MKTNPKENNETDFNPTLLDDGSKFLSRTANKLSLIDHQNNINNTNNKNHFEKYLNQQPENSTKLTQRSNLLNGTIPTLPNLNTHLTRLKRQNLVHLNTKRVILNTSIQQSSTNNKNKQLTQQQIVNFFRRFTSQNNHETTNTSTPYFLQATSTQPPCHNSKRCTQLQMTTTPNNVLFPRRPITHTGILATI